MAKVDKWSRQNKDQSEPKKTQHFTQKSDCQPNLKIGLNITLYGNIQSAIDQSID